MISSLSLPSDEGGEQKKEEKTKGLEAPSLKVQDLPRLVLSCSGKQGVYTHLCMACVFPK